MKLVEDMLTLILSFTIQTNGVDVQKIKNKDQKMQVYRHNSLLVKHMTNFL